MITLKEWMEVVDYRITEGSSYGWGCYGSDAYCLDSWNGDQDGHSLSVTFDQRTQVVYEVQIHDYGHNRAYRMINPDYVKAHTAEAEHRNSDMEEAWEGVNYTDLDVDDDWIQKALAVVAGEDYDTRVSVPIDLPEAELMTLFKQAHAADMTFNAYVEQILTVALEDNSFVDRIKHQY
jgi:hypothetical protein